MVCWAAMQRSLQCRRWLFWYLLVVSLCGVDAVNAKTRLEEDGYVLLRGRATNTAAFALLCAAVLRLPFHEMHLLPGTQADKKRRIKVLKPPGRGKRVTCSLYRALVRLYAKVGKEVLRESCPVYRPSIIATAPGAKPQLYHADLGPGEGKYVGFVAVHHRRLLLLDQPPVDLAPGDMLLMRAQVCHAGNGGAGLANCIFASHA